MYESAVGRAVVGGPERDVDGGREGCINFYVPRKPAQNPALLSQDYSAIKLLTPAVVDAADVGDDYDVPDGRGSGLFSESKNDTPHTTVGVIFASAS